MESDPALKNTHLFYEMTREEQMEYQYKKVRKLYELYRHKYLDKFDVDYDMVFDIFQGVVSISFVMI